VNRITTRCIFRLDVLPGPSRLPDKKILLVDDNVALWLERQWATREEEEDSLWNDILEGYNWEVIDTGEDYDDEVPIRFVNTATTVIWNVDEDNEPPGTQLLNVVAETGNYLSSYVKVGGNLIIVGKNPVYTTMYWPDGLGRSGALTDAVRPTIGTNFRSGIDALTLGLDFRPFVPAESNTGDTLYNWNWEVFGIERIVFPQPIKPFDGLVPCPSCDPGFQDTLATRTHDPGFAGEFGNAAYIAGVREDMDVRPLFTAALYDPGLGQWVGYGDDFLIGVYVPAEGGRGHAAYLGFPAFWFEHEKIKSLVRHLLDEFGEPRQEP
jgi:hypothetical protein